MSLGMLMDLRRQTAVPGMASDAEMPGMGLRQAVMIAGKGVKPR